MEENNSNDSTLSLNGRILHRNAGPRVSRVFKNVADVYLLIAPALTGRGRISQ